MEPRLLIMTSTFQGHLIILPEIYSLNTNCFDIYYLGSSQEILFSYFPYHLTHYSYILIMRLRLGCVDSSFSIDDCCSHLVEAQVATNCFIISGSDSSKTFQLVDVSFFNISQAVKLPLSWPLPPFTFGQDHCFCTSGFNPFNHGVKFIVPICDHHFGLKACPLQARCC